MLMLFALCFAQIATAAYVCPASPTIAAQAMDDMADCTGMAAMATPMDAEQPNLCKSHCAQDQQATASGMVIDVSPNLLVIFPCAATLAGQGDSAARLAFESAAPPAAPPPRILFQVFRS